jgi:hypothetical protein
MEELLINWSLAATKYAIEYFGPILSLLHEVPWPCPAEKKQRGTCPVVPRVAPDFLLYSLSAPPARSPATTRSLTSGGGKGIASCLNLTYLAT